MVDVQQRSLGAFEHNVLALAPGRAGSQRHRPSSASSSAYSIASSRVFWKSMAGSAGSSATGRVMVVQQLAQLWRRSARGGTGRRRAGRDAPPCPRMPGRCHDRWCRSWLRRGPLARLVEGDVIGQDQRTGRTDAQASRTGTPFSSSLVISRSSASGASTTPLPIRHCTPFAQDARWNQVRDGFLAIDHRWPAL